MNTTPKRRYRTKPKPLLTFTSDIPVKPRGPDEPHLVGYVRVSMTDQNNRRQVDELTKFGVNRIDVWGDKASGKNMNRPGWKACLRDLQLGDWLVVWSIGRLGRNLEEVVKLERELREKGATLKALAQDINTSTAAGRMIFHILLTVSQFEKQLEQRAHAAWLAEGERARNQGRPQADLHGRGNQGDGCGERQLCESGQAHRC